MSRRSSGILFLAVLVLITGFLGVQSAAAGDAKPVVDPVKFVRDCMKATPPPEAVYGEREKDWLVACLKNGGLEVLKARCSSFPLYYAKYAKKPFDADTALAFWKLHKHCEAENVPDAGFRHIVGAAWSYLKAALPCDYPAAGKATAAKALNGKPPECDECVMWWGCVYCVPPCAPGCQ